MDYTDTLIHLGKLITYHPAIIRRSIIYQDDLQILISLITNAVYAAFQVLFRSIYRDNDGNQWCVIGQLSSPWNLINRISMIRSFISRQLFYSDFVLVSRCKSRRAEAQFPNASSGRKHSSMAQRRIMQQLIRCCLTPRERTAPYRSDTTPELFRI